MTNAVEILKPEFIGWRVWEARPMDGSWALLGPSMPRVWQPGSALPKSIQTGVYAYRDRQDAMRYVFEWCKAGGDGNIYVVGRVAMWGGVQERRLRELFAPTAYPLSLDTPIDRRPRGTRPTADEIVTHLRSRYLNALALQAVVMNLPAVRRFAA